MNRKAGKGGNGGQDYIHQGCDYSDEEVEFLKAVDRYRTEHKKSSLTCIEILAVVKELGYRKTEPQHAPRNQPNDGSTDGGHGSPGR